jgi:hypothetical protein
MSSNTIRVWGDGRRALWTPTGPVDIPDDLVEVETGDAYLTRHIKLACDGVVYVRMKRDRRFSKAVAVLAPKPAVEAARRAARDSETERAAHRRTRTLAEEKRIAAFIERVLRFVPRAPPGEAGRIVVDALDLLRDDDPLSLHLAVRRRIRDAHTDYWHLVDQHGEREAIERVKPRIHVVLARWRQL